MAGGKDSLKNEKGVKKMSKNPMTTTTAGGTRRWVIPFERVG